MVLAREWAEEMPLQVWPELRPDQRGYVLGHEGERAGLPDRAHKLRQHVARVGLATLTAGDREWLAWSAPVEDGNFAAVSAPIDATNVAILARVNGPKRPVVAQRLPRGREDIERTPLRKSCALEAEIEPAAP